MAPCGCSSWHPCGKFSNVSATVYLLYKVTSEHFFENVCLAAAFAFGTRRQKKQKKTRIKPCGCLCILRTASKTPPCPHQWLMWLVRGKWPTSYTHTHTYIYIYIWLMGLVRGKWPTSYTHTHIYIYIYIYIYMADVTSSWQVTYIIYIYIYI